VKNIPVLKTHGCAQYKILSRMLQWLW